MEECMRIVKVLLKIIAFVLKLFYKILCFPFRILFGFLFGWIPDMDRKMTGEQFEEYVCEILKRNDYRHVQLTQRSGDYGIDILAQHKGQRYAIQCKFYQKPVGVAAVQQAYSGCVYYQCDYPVVVTNSSFTVQAQKLAMSNKVELWDGERLEKMKRRANAHSLFHKYHHIDHPYQEVLQLLLKQDEVSCLDLMENLGYSETKAYYILEDLEFYDLVGETNEDGQREVLFSSIDEAFKVIR